MDAGTEINSYRPDTHPSGLRENLFLTNLLSGTKICVEEQLSRLLKVKMKENRSLTV